MLLLQGHRFTLYTHIRARISESGTQAACPKKAVCKRPRKQRNRVCKRVRMRRQGSASAFEPVHTRREGSEHASELARMQSRTFRKVARFCYLAVSCIPFLECARVRLFVRPLPPRQKPYLPCCKWLYKTPTSF
jgi:hypothetical protein